MPAKDEQDTMEAAELEKRAAEARKDSESQGKAEGSGPTTTPESGADAPPKSGADKEQQPPESGPTVAPTGKGTGRTGSSQAKKQRRAGPAEKPDQESGEEEEEGGDDS